MAVRYALLACLLVVSGVACAQQTGQRQGTPKYVLDSDQDQLLAALKQAFQERNPKLTKVGVLELRSWDFLGPRVVLGWAIVGDKVFRGDFRDEMFGVFVVNESLTRVDRVVDVFPTPRWFDYELHFTRLTGDSVEVAGAGATYGDDPRHMAYKWR